MRRPILVLAFAAALAGCGNKGDLVLPDKAPPVAPVKNESVPDKPENGQKSALP